MSSQSVSARSGNRLPRVVIVGAGFAGLSAARRLRKEPVEVVVLDRRNHHLFQPLLYQVATAVLSPQDIAQPIRSILRRQKNVTVYLEEVTHVELDRKRVITRNGEVEYDCLILAAGATHSYFGNDQWEPYAPGLKTLENALDIRSRVLRAFEEAEIAANPEDQRAWLTFVIVGGGPTGVELSGAIAEIARNSMNGEFDHIDPASARILLVEALDRVLPPFPPELSAKALAQLQSLGVEVRFGNPVKEIGPGRVVIGDEELRAETVLWAAGVKASPLGAELGVPVDRPGRVIVDRTLAVPGHPEVFVAGDLASLKIDDKPVPGVAPAAMQTGVHAAGNAVRTLAGQPLQEFTYQDKGNLAIVGRNRAVAQIGSRQFSGFFAWLLWLVIHLGYLNGFRNRLIALIDWAWMYFTNNRGARLISGYHGEERNASNRDPATARAAAGGRR
ncbi:MAG: NAD(P)/FAD-dependent oxidoreductase [Chloroflexota bacterium]